MSVYLYTLDSLYNLLCDYLSAADPDPDHSTNTFNTIYNYALNLLQQSINNPVSVASECITVNYNSPLFFKFFGVCLDTISCLEQQIFHNPDNNSLQLISYQIRLIQLVIILFRLNILYKGIIISRDDFNSLDEEYSVIPLIFNSINLHIKFSDRSQDNIDILQKNQPQTRFRSISVQNDINCNNFQYNKLFNIPVEIAHPSISVIIYLLLFLFYTLHFDSLYYKVHFLPYTQELLNIFNESQLFHNKLKNFNFIEKRLIRQLICQIFDKLLKKTFIAPNNNINNENIVIPIEYEYIEEFHRKQFISLLINNIIALNQLHDQINSIPIINNIIDNFHLIIVLLYNSYRISDNNISPLLYNDFQLNHGYDLASEIPIKNIHFYTNNNQFKQYFILLQILSLINPNENCIEPIAGSFRGSFFGSGLGSNNSIPPDILQSKIKSQIMKNFVFSLCNQCNKNDNCNIFVLESLIDGGCVNIEDWEKNSSYCENHVEKILLELYSNNNSNFNIYSFFCLDYILLHSNNEFIMLNSLISIFSILVKPENHFLYEGLIQKSNFFPQLLDIFYNNNNKLYTDLLCDICIFLLKFCENLPKNEFNYILNNGINNIKNIKLFYKFLCYTGENSTELSYSQYILNSFAINKELMENFLSKTFPRDNSTDFIEYLYYIYNFFRLSSINNDENKLNFLSNIKFLPQLISSIRYIVCNYTGNTEELYENTLISAYNLFHSLINTVFDNNFVIIQWLQSLIQLNLDLFNEIQHFPIKNYCIITKILLKTIMNIQYHNNNYYTESQEIFRKLLGFVRINKVLNNLFTTNSPSQVQDFIEILILAMQLLLYYSYKNNENINSLIENNVIDTSCIVKYIEFGCKKVLELISIFLRLSINNLQSPGQLLASAEPRLKIVCINHFQCGINLFHHYLQLNHNNFDISFILGIIKFLINLARFSVENREIMVINSDNDNNIIKIILNNFSDNLLFKDNNIELREELFILLRILFTLKLNNHDQLLITHFIKQNTFNNDFIRKLIELILYSGENGRLWPYINIKYDPINNNKPIGIIKYIHNNGNNSNNINKNINNYSIEFNISIETNNMINNVSYPIISLNNNDYSVFIRDSSLLIVFPHFQYKFPQFKFSPYRWYNVNIIYLSNINNNINENQLILCVNGKLRETVAIKPYTVCEIANLHIGLYCPISTEWHFRLNSLSIKNLNNININKNSLKEYLMNNYIVCIVKNNFPVQNKSFPAIKYFPAIYNISSAIHYHYKKGITNNINNYNYNYNNEDIILSYSVGNSEFHSSNIEISYNNTGIIQPCGLSNLICSNVSIQEIIELLSKCTESNNIYSILSLFSSIILYSSVHSLFNPSIYTKIADILFSNNNHHNKLNKNEIFDLLFCHCGLWNKGINGVILTDSPFLKGFFYDFNIIFSNYNDNTSNNQFYTEIIEILMNSISKNENKLKNLAEIRSTKLLHYLAKNSNKIQLQTLYLNLFTVIINNFPIQEYREELELFKFFSVNTREKGWKPCITHFNSLFPVFNTIFSKIKLLPNPGPESGINDFIIKLFDSDWFLHLLYILTIEIEEEENTNIQDLVVTFLCEILDKFNIFSLKYTEIRIKLLEEDNNFGTKLRFLLNNSLIKYNSNNLYRIYYNLINFLFGIEGNYVEYDFTGELKNVENYINNNKSSYNYILNRKFDSSLIIYPIFPVLFNLIINYSDNNENTVLSCDILIFIFNYYNSNLHFRNKTIELNGNKYELHQFLLNLINITIFTIFPHTQTNQNIVKPNFRFNFFNQNITGIEEKNEEKSPLCFNWNGKNKNISYEILPFPSKLSAISFRLLCQIIFHSIQTNNNNKTFLLQLLYYCNNLNSYSFFARYNYISLLFRYLIVRILNRLHIWAQEFIENNIIKMNLLELLNNFMAHGDIYNINYSNYNSIQLILGLIKCSQFQSIIDYSVENRVPIISPGIFGLFYSVFTNSPYKIELINNLLESVHNNLYNIYSIELNDNNSIMRLIYLNQEIYTNSNIIFLNDENNELLLFYLVILLYQLLWAKEGDFYELLTTSAYKNLKLLAKNYWNIVEKQLIADNSLLARGFNILNNDSIQLFFEFLLVNTNPLIETLKSHRLYQNATNKIQSILKEKEEKYSNIQHSIQNEGDIGLKCHREQLKELAKFLVSADSAKAKANTEAKPIEIDDSVNNFIFSRGFLGHNFLNYCKTKL